MKSHLHAFLSAWLLLSVTACAAVTDAPPAPSGPGIFGVFEGITPCDPVSRPLSQIPEDSGCEQMIWKLALYRDPGTGNPTTYELDSAYGAPKKGTPGLEGGGKKIAMVGKWDILTGTAADPDAIVYRLNPDDPRAAVSFLKIADDILHLLDADGALKTGNASWSYTLNRTDNRARVDPSREAGEPPDSPTRPPIPPPPAGTNTLGIFEGRTPCHEIALEFFNTPAYPGCLKIKWRLSLYLDRKTGEPGAYLLVGTRTINQGTWTIIRGTKQDPNAVIYQLIPDHSQRPVFFLKADDNHLFLLDGDMNFLVGNALFSYTLSRTDKTAGQLPVAGSRVRVTTPRLDPGWHVGMLNRLRVEPICYVVLVFDPPNKNEITATLTLSEITQIQVGNLYNNGRAGYDPSRPSYPEEKWADVPLESLRSANKCRTN